MNKLILITIGAAIILIGIYSAFLTPQEEVIPGGTCAIDEDCVSEEINITNFQECLDAGYPAMESYPRQCAVPGGDTFTEILEK